MYKELNKYKTNKKITCIGVMPDKAEVDIKLDEYNFKMGDLMVDFIAHNKLPFWKRKYYHNHLNKIYVDVLNNLEIKHGL